jgi:hypothetical protein
MLRKDMRGKGIPSHGEPSVSMVFQADFQRGLVVCGKGGK